MAIPCENRKGFNKNTVKAYRICEEIATLTKINADDRIAFDKERKDFLKKIDELNTQIVNLNIEKNTLTAEKTALEIRYEESQKVMQMLGNKEQEPEPEEPQGLADKAVAVVDTMLGDGASQQLVAGLMGGLGEGISKLIDVGIAFAQSKGVLPNTQPQAEPVQPPPQAMSVQHHTLQALQQQQEQLNGLALENLIKN